MDTYFYDPYSLSWSGEWSKRKRHLHEAVTWLIERNLPAGLVWVTAFITAG